MKKLIVFALCAISACSVFAEPFSKAKFDEIWKTRNLKQLRKYCQNAQPSSQSDAKHMNQCFAQYRSSKTRLNKQQILQKTQNFKKVLSDAEYQRGLRLVYGLFGIEEQIAINSSSSNYVKKRFHSGLIIFGDYKKALAFAQKYDLKQQKVDDARLLKDDNKYWKYAKQYLTIRGGNNNPQENVKVITYMFRYKPQSVTKEQQIELLSKLAQIYPIPGTDFNKWKAFMGFVGFKYKALTGKDLF